jgi:hypothetical protein
MLLRRAVLRRGFTPSLRTPKLTLALGFSGLWGSNAAFLMAIEAGAAPVPVTIVAHTWPVWMVMIVLIARIARGTIWDLFARPGFAGVIGPRARARSSFITGSASLCSARFSGRSIRACARACPPGRPMP